MAASRLGLTSLLLSVGGFFPVRTRRGCTPGVQNNRGGGRTAYFRSSMGVPPRRKCLWDAFGMRTERASVQGIQIKGCYGNREHRGRGLHQGACPTSPLHKHGQGSKKPMVP